MLPDVQAQNRRVAAANAQHQRVVLVGAAFHMQLAAAVHAEPGPAAAKAADGSLGEFGLEVLEAAKVLVNGCCKSVLRKTSAAGRHDLPEQAVIGMAAAVVAHGLPQRLRQRFDLGEQIVQRPLRVLAAFECRIEVVDVGLMVPAVVDLHGLRIDMRLQCRVVVGQWGQGIAHD